MRTLPQKTTPHGNLAYYAIDSMENDVTRLYLTAHMPVPHQCAQSELSFFGEMLGRGSRAYPKDRYDEILESLGAQVGFDTDGATLTLRVVVLTAHVSRLLPVLTDMLARPLFLKSEIQKAKKEFFQALHEEGDNARTTAYGLFSRALYAPTESGYVPNRAARRRTLAAITERRLRMIHAQFLSASWVVSSASTREMHTHIMHACARVHKETPAVPTASTAMSELPQRVKALHVEKIPGKQNIELFIGSRLPITLTHPDFLAFSVGLDVLGKRGGFTGRLMKTVRDKEGLTYMIYAWIRGATATTCGHFNVSTFFTPQDVTKGLSLTRKELTKIAQKGITANELTRFQELLTNQFQLTHEATSSVLSLYHRAFVAGRSYEDIVDYPLRLAALSRTEVNRALRNYLNPEALVVAAAGPVDAIKD